MELKTGCLKDMEGGAFVSCNIITLNWFQQKPFALMTRSFGQFTMILKLRLLENWSTIQIFPQKLAASRIGGGGVLYPGRMRLARCILNLFLPCHL